MTTHYVTAEQLHIPAIPRSVALGLFDGLHPGHRRVIVAAVEDAADDWTPAVFTFLPHSVVKDGYRRLTDDREEEHLLKIMGVQEQIKADFAAIRHLSPEEFVRDILRDALCARHVTCGFNYRFGAKGAGDAALLTALCAQYGITVTVVPEVDCGGTPVNATAIRAALADGDMPRVRRLLGRPYRLRLPVSHGQQLGRRLGLPTINQTLPADMALPRFGVYASCVQWDGHTYPAVTNVGVRPTVGSESPLAETYILGFDGDLYDAEPAVYPLQYLRPEQTFDTLDALQTQIQRDVAAVEAMFAPPARREVRAVLFDFDDTLDNRDAALRQGLYHLVRYYYPSLSEAESTARSEAMFLYQRGDYGQIVHYWEMLEHYFALYPPEVPVDVPTALHRMVALFATAGQVHPDVLPTLTALRERGYRLGIITNGTAYNQARKIDHTGLQTYMDLVVLAGEEGIQKPDPRLFRMAAARLGVPCECCVFVGDNPHADIQGARDAGMIPLRKHADLDPEHPLHRMEMPADVPVIENIGDLPAWLDRTTT